MTIVSRHTQAAPATAYALSVVRNLRHFEETNEDGELSLILLTIAAQADNDLYSGNGYNGITVEQVADLLGLAVGETQAAMDRLRTEIGYLDPDTYPGGRYRIPQVAYDRSNGE